MVKVEEILKLSTEEKISLIETLWDSLDEEQSENLLTKEQEENLLGELKAMKEEKAKHTLGKSCKRALNYNEVLY